MSWIPRGTYPLRRLTVVHLVAFALAFPFCASVSAQTEVGAKATLSATSDSPDATRLFFDGLTEAENIATARAVELMDEAIALDPEFGLALAGKAFYDGSLSAPERAAAFSRAIGALGDATPGEIAFATGLREWRSGNTTAAKRMFDLAAEAAPGDPHVAFYRALLQVNTSTPAEGITALRAVTERFPDLGPAFNILAYSLYRAGDTQGGLDAARRYLQLLPDHWNAHDTMAEMMGWEGRFDDALTHYGHVVSMVPEQLQGYAGRSEVYTMMGQGADARAALTEALSVASTDAAKVNLHRAIGNSFALDGDRRAATRELGMAAELATGSGAANLAALAHQEMALWEALSGNRGSIQGHLDAAQAAGGPAPRQAGLGALALAIGGDLQAATAAAAELESVVRDAANFEDLSHQVNALVKLRQGDAAGAKTELGMADPSDLLTKAILAETYKALGQDRAAATLRQDVLNDRRANLYSTGWVAARLKATKIKI